MATYRVPVLEQFAWQEPVLVMTDGLSPAPVATKGNRYIALDILGAFAGLTSPVHGAILAGDIVWYDDGAWKFDRPTDGWKAYNKDDGAFYVYEAGSWSSASVMDGLTLTGDVDSSDPNNPINWLLSDDNADSLKFVTAADIEMLNMDTTDGAEVLSTDATLRIDSGKVDLTPGATNVALGTATDALTFSRDTTSILTIDSTNLAVKVDRDLTIEGDLLVKGATTTIETSQLVVEDKLITLNKGATAPDNGGDAGIEFELDGVAAGYIKTDVDGNNFVFNTPQSDAIMTLITSADSTLTMAGNLDVETEGGKINQDLTTDSTTVEFAGLKLTGDMDLSDAAGGNITLAQDAVDALNVDGGTFAVDTTGGDKKVLVAGTLGVTGLTKLTGDLQFTAASDIDVISDAVDALQINSADLDGIFNVDTTIGSEKVTMAGGLDVTGEVALSAGLSVTNDITIGETSSITDGTASATVAEMQTAYDTRGQWDSDLKVMRFVDPDTYVAP